MDNVATTPALRERLVIDALIRAGAMNADEELTLILLDPATNMTSYLPPERARALVPKLIREMLMFNSASAEFNMIDTIVQLFKNTPGYNANPDELRNDEANDAEARRRLDEANEANDAEAMGMRQLLVFDEASYTFIDEQYDLLEEQQRMELGG